MHTGNTVQTEKVVFTCLGMCMNTYVTAFKGKEAMNFRESKGGSWEG